MSVTHETVTIEQARALLNGSLANAEHEMESTYPHENTLNDNSRLMISAFRNRYGEAWLGIINIPHAKTGQFVLWEWEGDTTANYGAAFVVPEYDEKLVRMIFDRYETPYTTTAADAPLVHAIIDRVKELGGELLVWN